jgi:hypothetical protein
MKNKKIIIINCLNIIQFLCIWTLTASSGKLVPFKTQPEINLDDVKLIGFK